MEEFSLSVDDGPGQVDSNSTIQSIFKVPFGNESKDMINTPDNKYLIRTTDGQLLWVSYSVDPTNVACDSAPAVFLLHSKEPQFIFSQDDGNVLKVSSFDDFSICDEVGEEEDDINTDDILKVEDRVKVFDAILAPIEKKAKVKTRVGFVEEDDKFANYVCDLCGSSFVKAVQYYGHLHLHSGEFLWECRLCPDGTRFTSQSQLRRHEKKYHFNLRPHTCTECGATFDRPSQLDYHKRRIHEGERSHSCQLCGKAFFKRSDLRTHLNTHLSVHGCMCEICGRRFSHVSNLTRHIRIHSGVKPYPCSICGRRFNQLNSLNEHKASHVNQDPVSCCDKVFKNQVVFKKHLKLVHNSNDEFSDQAYGNKRRFHCKVCGNSFPFLTLLRKHEMTHNQFTCCSCKEETSSLEELKNHSCYKAESITDDGIYDKEINDRLDDMYLDPDSDWMDAESISQSQFDKFAESDSPLRVESLSCDNLDAAKSLCYSAAEVDKLVEETCYQVSADNHTPVVNGDCLEIDSLITPIPPSSPSVPPVTDASPVVSILTALNSSNCISSVTCDSLVPSVVFEQSLPVVDDPLDITSIVQDCAKVIEDANKCLSNEEEMMVDNSLNSNVNFSNSNQGATVSVNDAVNYSNNNITADVTADALATLVNVDADTGTGCDISNVANENKGNDDKVTEENSDGNDSNTKDIAANDDKNGNDSNNNSTNENGEIIYKAINIKDAKDKAVKRYTCTVCGKRFLKASNFRQHQGIHDIRRQLHRCKVCGRSFAWKSTLNKHVLLHSENPNPAIFPCDFCDKLYSTSSLLQAHINRDHLKQRPHVCSICKKTFFKKYDLKIHTRTHTNERPYICGTCGRGFGHISHLIRHERIHSGHRPYQCSFCPASFIQSTALASHQKHHMKEQPERARAVCYLEFVIEHPKINDCS